MLHCYKPKIKIIIESLTFCISASETNERAIFSKLSFKTSMIRDVITSACFEGTPCASNLRTCQHANFLIITTTTRTYSKQVEVGYRNPH